jgi:hypothetical protein
MVMGGVARRGPRFVSFAGCSVEHCGDGLRSDRLVTLSPRYKGQSFLAAWVRLR